MDPMGAAFGDRLSAMAGLTDGQASHLGWETSDPPLE